MSGAQGVTARFDPVASHALTLTLAGTGAGTVTSMPAGIACTWSSQASSGACVANFAEGTAVTLTASANAGSFTGWGGQCGGTGRCTVTLDQPVSVSAEFALPMHPLTVTGSGTGSGTIASNPAGIGCAIDAGVATTGCSSAFTEGVVVTLTASATAGSFVGWSGACSGSGNCQVTIDQAKSVTADFELPTYTVTIEPSGSGSATISSAPEGLACSWSGGAATGDCSADFTEGTVVSISWTGGGTFEGWGGGCGGAGECQFVVLQPRSVSAAFIANQELVGLAANALTGAGSLSAVLRTALDAAGNHDGSFDIGDLVALVDRTPGASLTSVLTGRRVSP